jgi:hypothetical protein
VDINEKRDDSYRDEIESPLLLVTALELWLARHSGKASLRWRRLFGILVAGQKTF